MIIPLGRELPHASSDRPGSFGRATLKRPPIWSCSGWGLPSQPGRPGCWWSLTPPFHPCLSRGSWLQRPSAQMRGGDFPSSPWARARAGGTSPAGHRRSVFCGTVRRVAPPGCYPATRSLELGLSSGPLSGTRDHLTNSGAPDSAEAWRLSVLQYKIRWQCEQVRT